MAGTLTISTLSDGTNSTSSTNCIQGSAKAWVNFNGVTTATVRASYNVSSVTRNGTGDYTVNFTNAMSDANYTVCFGAGYTGGTSGGNSMNVGCFREGSVPTASNFRMTVNYQNGGISDSHTITASVFR